MSATHGSVREDMAPNTNTSRDVDMNTDNSTSNPMDMDTTTTTEAYTPMYKGKVTHRSWQQLPEEIVRLITTYFLYDYSTTAYCPQTWENRRQWYSRMVFTAIRDTIELERIMGVCPEWKRAIETHLFWNQVINILDPNDVLLYHMAINPKAPQSASHNHNNASHNHQNHSQSQTYLTPYQHLRGILNSSCLICRINYPLANTGLAQAKKLIYTMNLGAIPVCKEHDKRKTHFCWLCCRDSPTLHTNNNLNAQIGQGGFMSDAISGALGMSAREREREREREYDIIQALAIVENEDEDLWPGVVATCRKCRAEWLWRRASLSPRDAEAVGGPALHPSDWETRQNVEGFLDLGEGTVADLVLMAREKAWLRRWTRYDSLGMHFLGAARGAGGGGEREREHKGKGGANNSTTNPLGGGFGMFGLGKDLAQNGTALANALGLPSPNPLAEEEEEAEGEDASSSISSEDEVDSDSEEDRELMLMRGATQVRDLALQDWCRQRILDGHWISPADAWFRNEVPGFGAGVRVPTTHPCPWAREDSNSTSGPGASRSLGGGNGNQDPSATMDVPHPLESTLRCEPPATFGLAEQAFNTHVRQMKEILGPALRNVVRKVVMECSVYTPPSRSRNADGEEDVIEGGYEDPLRRVQRMDLEEVVRILREEEGVWYEGVDWLEKRRNEEEAEAEVRAARDRNTTHREREQEDAAAASPLSSASSTSSSEGQRSNNSNSTGTSPVLSTTTLQTTPSPPPVPVRPPKSAESDSDRRGYQKGKAQGGEDDEQQTPQQSQTQTGQTQPQSQSQSQNAPSKANANSNLNSNANSNSKTKPKPRRAFNPTPRLIPIDPVRSPPRLLSKIPYVPVTVRHLPAYSLEALKAAWRDACAPLYHCRCSVCERAKMAEMNARAAAQGYSVPQQQQQVQYPPQQQQQYAPPNVQQQQQVVQQPVTLSVPLRGGGYAPNANATLIELKEAVLERGPEARREEEEEEEELDDVDEYASDEDEVDYSEEEDGYSDGYVDEDDLDEGEGEDADAAEQPPLPPPRPTQTQAAPGAKDVNVSSKGTPATAPAETRTYSRKRSSDELLDEYGRDRDTPAAAAAALAKSATSNAATTPPSPKRQRIVGGDGEEGRPRSLSSGSEASEHPSSRQEEKSRYFPTRPPPHSLSQPPSPTGPPSSSPGRMRKRNSEELEEGVEVDADRLGKRAKVTLGEGKEVQEVASPDSVGDVPLPVAGREAVVGKGV